MLKTRGFPIRGERYGAKYENGVAYLPSLLYCISRKTVDTEYTYYSWCMTSTDIVKWRKTNDYEHFEKGMIYMKILKKGGSREKGKGETKAMPHAPVVKRALVENVLSTFGKLQSGIILKRRQTIFVSLMDILYIMLWTVMLSSSL